MVNEQIQPKISNSNPRDFEEAYSQQEKLIKELVKISNKKIRRIVSGHNELDPSKLRLRSSHTLKECIKVMRCPNKYTMATQHKVIKLILSCCSGVVPKHMKS